MKFIEGESYKTRNGFDAVIYKIHVSMNKEKTIHGAIKSNHGDWKMHAWNDLGESIGDNNPQGYDGYDLAEHSKRKIAYISNTDHTVVLVNEDDEVPFSPDPLGSLRRTPFKRAPWLDQPE